MELVRVPVDVLFTIGTRATRIVAATVKTTPVVTYSCDPFEHVMQLARPGGNITGVTCMTTEMMPKRLEMLKELLPSARRLRYCRTLRPRPMLSKLLRPWRSAWVYS
jgi:putative ABC transport system substrate-binding protein